MKRKIATIIALLFAITIISINSSDEFRYKFRCYVMSDYNSCLKNAKNGKNIKATQKLCDLGNEVACFNMGIYSQFEIKDLNKSIMYYKLACDKNYSDACVNLAEIYATSFNNTARAFKLFKKGCDNGNSLSCQNLAICYLTGTGTARDINKSIKYFNISCKNNMSVSCSKLANIYFSDELGLLDYKKAYNLYDKSCSLDNQNFLACVLKGFMLYEGLGTDENKKLGLEILNDLCDKGAKDSCLMLKNINDK